MAAPDRSASPGAAHSPVASPPQRGIFGGGAWSLGHVAGIRVAIDHTWVLIFLLVTFSLGAQLHLVLEGFGLLAVGVTAAVTSLLFFASILLHELGHSLVAQRVGVHVESITLYVFGGLAQLSSDARRPRDEFLIAVAGPAVSVLLGFAFVGFGGALAGADGWAQLVGEAARWLGRINLVVAAFNAVPGFPLDGGRVLRSLVWAVTGSFERATAIAAVVGSFFAYSLIGFGFFVALLGGQLLGGLWLAFIGWFLLSAARAAVGGMVFERILERVTARDAMETVEEGCVSGAESIAEVVADAVLRRGLRTLYVVGPDRRLRGLVTLRELAGVPDAERARRRVEEVAVPLEQLAVLAPEEGGWLALRRMAERNVNQLPVVDAGGRLVGAVTREHLIAIVQAHLALGGPRGGLRALGEG